MADQAILTILDADLRYVSHRDIATPCRSATMVSGSRLVCGADRETRHTYSVPDLRELGRYDAEHVSASIRRVPGTDDFVSVGSYDEGFTLGTAAGSTPKTIADQDHWNNGITVSRSFAFIFDPATWPRATHLINEEGVLLEIYGSGCYAESEDAQCLVPDGQLGVLPVAVDTFMDLRGDEEGFVYGIWHYGEPRAFWSPCEDETCFLERIDPQRKVVVDSCPFKTAGEDRLYVRPTPDGARVAIIAEAMDRSSQASMEPVAFTVRIVEF